MNIWMICLCHSCPLPPSYTFLSGIILLQLPVQPTITAALARLFCWSEKTGETQLTHTSHSQLYKCRDTSMSTRTQKPVESSVQGRTCRKADSSGCGWPMDLGLRARYREKGNNFMPKCIKEEYTGNKSKHFFHPDRLQQLPLPL